MQASTGRRPIEAWQAVKDILNIDATAQQLFDASEPILTERYMALPHRWKACTAAWPRTRLYCASCARSLEDALQNIQKYGDIIQEAQCCYPRTLVAGGTGQSLCLAPIDSCGTCTSTTSLLRWQPALQEQLLLPRWLATSTCSLSSPASAVAMKSPMASQHQIASNKLPQN